MARAKLSSLEIEGRPSMRISHLAHGISWLAFGPFSPLLEGEFPEAFDFAKAAVTRQIRGRFATLGMTGESRTKVHGFFSK